MKKSLITFIYFILLNNLLAQDMRSKSILIDLSKSENQIAVVELNPDVFSSMVIKFSKHLDSKVEYCLNSLMDECHKLKRDNHIDESIQEPYTALIIVGRNQRNLYFSFNEENEGLLEIELIEDLSEHRNNKKTNFLNSETCICPSPDYFTRTEWGCPWGDESPNFIPVASKLTHFVIHHQGGNPSPPYDATVRAIWNYHVNSNGWEDIGYHWLIDPDGNIYKGRAWLGEDENVLGAHMCGCNANKLGICLLGDFTNIGPTTAQYTSLINFLSYKSCNWEIDPGLSSLGTDRTSGSCQAENVNHVISHKDGCPINYTECPGATFYAQFNQLKSDLIESYQNCKLETHSYEEDAEKLTVFPNPFNTDFTINFNPEELAIFDLYGTNINYIKKVHEGKTQITILAPSGIYVLRNSLLTSKIIKL